MHVYHARISLCSNFASEIVLGEGEVHVGDMIENVDRSLKRNRKRGSVSDNQQADEGSLSSLQFARDVVLNKREIHVTKVIEDVNSNLR